MSLRDRPFLRFLLAALGVLLCMAIGAVFLGWAVASGNRWLAKVLGLDKWERLYAAYAQTAATLFPKDQDGDGVCDGLEIFYKTDSQNAWDHPSLLVEEDYDGYFAHIAYEREEVPPLSLPRESIIGYPIWCRMDERVQWRGRLATLTTPKGFQLRIVPEPGGRVGLPGDPLTPKAILAPVAFDGSFAIDIQVTATPRATDPAGMAAPIRFRVEIPTTAESLGSIYARQSSLGKPLLPVHSTVSAHDTPDEWVYRMTFAPGDASADFMLLQVARDTENAVWRDAGSVTDLSQPLKVFQSPTFGGNAYKGRLQFRLIPVQISRQ